jgi:hypothetical protein
MDELHVDEKTALWNQRLKIPVINFPKDLFTFYLSHPTASRHYIRKWELGFEKKHEKIALLNPFYDLEGEGLDDIKAKDEGKKFKELPGYAWRMTQRDYIAIAYARGIVCIVDENYDKSLGTVMEMVMGRVLAKNPKLLICTNKNLIEHPWLTTHFHKIYPSFESFEKDVEFQVARVKKKWGF